MQGEREGPRPSLILASSSTRRRQLLRSAGIRFEVLASDLPETRSSDETPRDYVRRMARAKGAQIAKQRRRIGDERVVLSADTIVVIEDDPIGKPVDREDAGRMLRRLAGRTHQVLTAFCLLDGERSVEQLVSTDVTFKPLTSDEIERYLDSADWGDKAGAYAIQSEAAYIVREISGSYTNVVGLPLCEAIESLERLGIAPGAPREEAIGE